MSLYSHHGDLPAGEQEPEQIAQKAVDLWCDMSATLGQRELFLLSKPRVRVFGLAKGPGSKLREEGLLRVEVEVEAE